jgi:hypothetical protein
MEMSQGNFLYSYYKQTEMSFFFSFTKSENIRVEEILPRAGGVSTSGWERRWGNSVRGQI